MGLYKRGGSSIWWTRFKYGGRTFRRSTGQSNQRSAEKQARKIRVEVEATEPAPRSGQHRVTIIELSGFDVERATAGGVSAKQIATLEEHWLHLCRKMGADTPVDTITYDSIEKFIAAMRGEGYRGQSIRKYVQALKRGMVIAKRRKLLQKVPSEWPEVRSDPPKETQKGKWHEPSGKSVV